MPEAASIFLRYQSEWIADKTRVKVIVKSRRIGISWASAADSVIDAASVEGCDVWYVGYNKSMAEEFIRDCAWWSKVFSSTIEGEVSESFFEDENPDRKILTFTIRFASGFRISALSSRPTNLRNKRGRIIIDEAAFHPDLRALLKSAMAVLIWGGKSRVDIISTHNGTETDFYTLVEDIKAGKKPYSLHHCTIDDALEQGFYKRICHVNREEWTEEKQLLWREQLFEEYGEDATEELLCVPARSGGVYLSKPLIERQMRPGKVFHLDLKDEFLTQAENARVEYVSNWCKANLLQILNAWPKDKLCFFGEDFGRVSDRTVIAIGYLTQTLVRRFPLVVELCNVPFEQQRQVLFYLIDRLPRGKLLGGALDATGNGGYLAEQAALRYGPRTAECVNITDKWYSENLPPFRAGFEDRQIEVVKDVDHLIDLSHFRVINGIPKLPKLKTQTAAKKGPLRHGDAGIAYALGYAASRKPIPEYDYLAGGTPTKRHETFYQPRPSRRSGGIL